MCLRLAPSVLPGMKRQRSTCGSRKKPNPGNKQQAHVNRQSLRATMSEDHAGISGHKQANGNGRNLRVPSSEIHRGDGSADDQKSCDWFNDHRIYLLQSSTATRTILLRQQGIG